MTASNMARIVRLPLILAGLAAATTAMAKPPQSAAVVGESRTMVVSYSDLDLNRPAGASVLYQRLRSASEQVCGERPDPRLLEQRADFDACRQEALAGAVQSVNAPMLSQLADPHAAPQRLAGK